MVNRPVSCKLKYLWNINGNQLTVVVQNLVAVWRPYNVQKLMGYKAIITTGTQAVLNFLIIKTKR